MLSLAEFLNTIHGAKMSCNPKNNLLLLTDIVRSIAGPTNLFGGEGLNLRATELQIISRTWSGLKLGLGTPTDEVLTVVPRVFVESVSGAEISNSGGRYQTGDVKVSSITPAYDGYCTGSYMTGGYTPSQLKPTTNSKNKEFIYRLMGPDPGDYALIDADFISEAMTYYLVIRRTRYTP